MTVRSPGAPGSRAGTEVARQGPVPWLEIESLASRFPWLAAGITCRGDGEPADMGLFGASPVGAALGRWRSLRESLGFETILHSRQVHGAGILVHRDVPPGFHLAPDADGHTTDRSGLLLTVSVADCVPIWIVDATVYRVTLLHAGWRGVATRILEKGLDLMRDLGPRPADLHIHLGPAICGPCYEVGPEVHAALGFAPPPGNATVDLRAVLAERARADGIPAGQLSSSSFCTRCDGDVFFSHRGGSPGRQIAFVGIRADHTA